jgi:hypothetical protein
MKSPFNDYSNYFIKKAFAENKTVTTNRKIKWGLYNLGM